jgi:hypothetical protein
MDPLLATPDAVREFRTARNNLFRAVTFDREQGVSANRIASMTAGAVSRPVLLRILHSEQTKADAVQALKDHRLRSYVDVGIAGGRGWGARHAYLLLALDPAEIESSVKETLFADVVRALDGAGLSLGDATEQAWWEGEELPINVPGTAP